MINELIKIINQTEDNKLSIVDQYGENTYGDFNKGLLKIDSLFENHRISNKSVLLIGEANFKTIIYFIALLKRGNVVSPLISASSDEIEQKKSIFNPQMIVNSINSEIHNLHSYFQEKFQNIYSNKSSGLILFSSGTSGKIKAAYHDTDRLLQKFIKRGKDFSTLAFMNIDHIGGIDTLFYCLFNSSTLIYTNNRSTKNICELIEEYKIEVLPTTPSFLRLLLLSRDFQDFNLGSLKIITFGTEPMSDYLLNNLKDEFPGVKFIQKFGTTETGTLRTKISENNPNWLKIDDSFNKVRIRNNKLEIKSVSSMIGYLNHENPFTDDGWYKTGDLVEVKGDYYRIIGRESEIINVGGEKVNPSEIEEIINSLPEIKNCLVFGMPNPILGNIVACEIELNNIDLSKTEIKVLIKKHLSEKVEDYKIPIKFKIVNEILISNRFKKKRRKNNNE